MDRITRQSSRPRGYGSTSSLRNDSLKHTRTVQPGRADCPWWPRVPSDRVPRTVRTLAADCPAWPADRPLKRTEPPEPTREKRTVRGDRADRPRGPRTVRYWSSDRPQTGCDENLKQNQIKTKRNKNTKNARWTGSSQTVRRPLADRPRLTDRTENSPTSKVNSPKSSSDFTNGRSCRDKGLGTWKASHKDAIAQKSCLLTP
jgi:hypothetical protein